MFLTYLIVYECCFNGDEKWNKQFMPWQSWAIDKVLCSSWLCVSLHFSWHPLHVYTGFIFDMVLTIPNEHEAQSCETQQNIKTLIISHWDAILNSDIIRIRIFHLFYN